jgi:hypothetical protein
MITSTYPKKTGEGKTNNQTLGINERLALIGLIEEGMRLPSSDSPIVADLFGNLWDLVDKTVSGSKISGLNFKDSKNGFKALEIKGEAGESLGRLNMLYLKKPIPCYYLVYVEVAAAFRQRGLGARVLARFRDFLIEKSAVGLLDNIIPEGDPTYNIYGKMDWRPADEVCDIARDMGDQNYMIYIPPSMREKDLKSPVAKLLSHINRKRAVIDMRDNELMVARTIEEFKELYAALTTYFEKDLKNDPDNALMRFMFTRFATKLLGFSHRIRELLGYTGGESLDQIALDPAVANLRVQSYAPSNLASQPSFHSGAKELWLSLPEELKNHPARMIERLPNYQRPSLVSWLEKNERSNADSLTIGDLMDMGFDPTRLKEITINNEPYIFERVQIRQLEQLERRGQVLGALMSKLGGARVKGALLKTNPPVLVIRDKGNGYVLRKKVEGIHWDEAIEQLNGCDDLKDLNASVKVEKKIKSTVVKASELARSKISGEDLSAIGELAIFVSWDIKGNRPKLVVDMGGSFLESVWVA